MTTTPEPEPADVPTSSEMPLGSARRIAIGTQRPGVKPPAAAPPRYEYVVPGAAAQSLEPSAQPAEPEGGTAPPAAPAGDPSTGSTRREGSRRPRGGTRPPAPPTTTRVAVPNIRAALDDDLEADFAAALEGVAVDDLLATEATAKADAPLDPGTRVTGRVLSIGPDTAFLDLGARRQGAMKLASFLERGDEIPAVGESIDVTVGSRSEEDGLYDVAPANRAVAVEDWSHLEAGMVVEARVTAANKGGLECDVAGLRGFMPASLVSTWRIENLEELVGQTLDSLVTEIVPAARRLVLSRRAVIERQAADARVKLLETLEPGAELDGTVRTVRDFGAFVDIGDGVEGLVHVSELSWERVPNAADVLQPGQKVRVVVKKIDRQTGKIGLSARDLVESPWKRAADRYHVGAVVRGTVSRIAQFGAFVRLEAGVEGLVHISELAGRHIRSVSDVVKEGEQVECRVLAVDPDEQRMSLSIKALAPAPAARTEPHPDETQPQAEELAAPPAAAKKRSAPLKGGLGGGSAGERFGLRW